MLLPSYTRLQTIILCVLFVFTNSLVFAGVAGLPDSAQPGAQRPDLSERTERPTGEAEDVVEIPAVIERPLAIDEGPRIDVKRFELINASDFPELNVSVDELEELIENLRLLRPEGFTVGRLQEVANAVTAYYRDRELILAQAVIPVQDVEQGIVKIEIFVGYLDRVLVEGQQVYDAEVLQSVFDDLINQPIVQHKIETALLRLTDYPGLRVYGIFQPGQLIGTADLVLNVQEEDRFAGNFRVDNHGTQETGRIRGRIDLEWNSLFGDPDKVAVLVQQAYKPKESEFYFIEYERFFANSLLFGVSFDRSDYGVGGVFSDQQITGDGEDINLYMEKSFLRSRLQNFSGTIRFTRSESNVQSFGIDQAREVLSVLNLSLLYDVVDDWDPFSFIRSDTSEFVTSSINFFNFEVSHGLEDVFGSLGSRQSVAESAPENQPNRQGGSGDFASGEFTRLFASYIRYQNLAPGQSLLFRTEWQWSDDLLLSQEQFSIGGPNSVRAFSPSFQLVDSGGFLSVEYIFDAPFFGAKPVFDNYSLQELLQISVYYDVAVGKLNDPGPFDETGWKSYQGVGIGAQFNLPGQFDSRLLAAWPIGEGHSEEDVGNGRVPQIWLDFSISF